MKLLILIGAVLTVVSAMDYDEEEMKYHQNLAELFEKHLIPFNKRLALEVNHYTKGHFIISPHNIWYNLSPEIENNTKLFSFMNLPDEASVRKQIYSRALQLGGLGEFFSFSRSQALVVDETIEIHKDWKIFKEIPAGMPDYLESLKFEEPFGHVQNYIANYQPVPNSYHTVLLDHLMFEDLWNSAFSARTIQQGPFYNKQGKPIGTVEYLRMKDKVRVAQSPDNTFKILEVPTSEDRSILLAVGAEVKDMIEAVFSGHIFSDLKLTDKPIEVAVPRLLMSSAVEMVTMFNNMRSSKEFSEAAATSDKTDLPEFPRGYYHMVTVNVTESLDRNTSEVTALSDEKIDFAILEKEGFIVNRPFLFALFVPLYKSTVKLPVFTGAYSYPGERGQKRN